MYRDYLIAARHRQRQLNRDSKTLGVPSTVIRIYAKRVGRIAAGAAGLGTIGAMSMVFLVTGNHRALAAFFVAAWVAMGLAYLMGRTLGAFKLKRLLQTAFGSSGDLFFDLARLDRGRPEAVAFYHAQALERPSLQLPLLALSLLAPLSIHMLVGVVIFGTTLGGFGEWIVTSAVLVGHAHITLGLFSLYHVVYLQRELDGEQLSSGTSRGLVALMWTVAASAIPGVVLICIPPLLVGLTGLVFVPWMFGWSSSRAVLERIALSECGVAPLAAPTSPVTHPPE